MNKTDQRDVLELLRILEENNVDYFVPTKMVPYYPDGVKCGYPEELAAYTYDMVLQQMEGTGEEAHMSVKAVGDSMRDAGIQSGDRLWVSLTQDHSDGDIIVVMIDGKCTAKTFFADPQGRKWLVPENDAYRPIQLTEDQDIRIVGKVLAVTHRVRSSSYAACVRKVKAMGVSTEEEKEELVAVPLIDKQVEKAIKAIVPQLKNSRHWYSVFRVLVDHRYYKDTDYEAFANRVNALCPDAKYRVNAVDLGRMAYRSFAKSVCQWDVRNAPVKGKCYQQYYDIAISFDALLKEKK